MVELLRIVEQVDDGVAGIGACRHNCGEVRVPHAPKRVPASNELDHLGDVEALLGEIVGEGLEAVPRVRYALRAGDGRIDSATSQWNDRARASGYCPHRANRNDIRTCGTS